MDIILDPVTRLDIQSKHNCVCVKISDLINAFQIKILMIAKPPKQSLQGSHHPQDLQILQCV